MLLYILIAVVVIILIFACYLAKIVYKVVGWKIRLFFILFHLTHGKDYNFRC